MADLGGRRTELDRSWPRFAAFVILGAGLLALLAGRLVQLQILDAHLYQSQAAATRTDETRLSAPRGAIFDRHGRAIAVNEPSWRVLVVPSELPATPGRVLRAVAALTSTPIAEIRARLEAGAARPDEPVVVAREVGAGSARLIGERRPQLPGVSVESEPIRGYLAEDGRLDGPLLSHVLGYVGPIAPEQVEEVAALGYPLDGVIGKAGVELSWEAQLRGVDGARLVERDPSGRQLKVIETLRQPVPGTNLLLTIDLGIQRAATDALSWGMEVAGVQQGVVLVMDPHTGEILAMVSLPAYDNNLFATGISADAFESYLTDPGQPLRNHAIADHYPPGSTFKLVTAIAALEEGVTAPTQRWPTYACFQIPGAPSGECLHDWNRRGFGPLNVGEAFSRSSDTFFYQLALETGIDPLAEWAAELGFGSATGVELPGEAAGIVASTRWAQGEGRPGLFSGEVAMAGIGQGPIAVTPLQLLNAYAALANGGTLFTPRIVFGEADEGGRLVTEYPEQTRREIGVSDASQALLREAARQVISSGHAYNIRDLPLPGALSGKTGTAEFGAPLADGHLPYHSWFVAWLPSSSGATDAELAVLAFTYGASVRGNVSVEVVKHFLQLHFGIERDYRLDPRTVRLLDAT